MLQAEEAALFRQLEFMMRMLGGDLKRWEAGNNWWLTVDVGTDTRRTFRGETLQGVVASAWAVVRPGH